MNNSNYPCLTRNNLVSSPKFATRYSIQLHSLLNQFWQRLIHWIETRHEPKITQQFDRQGHSIGWQVFDPETGYITTFGSELEVRLWLEYRYR